MTSQMVIKCSGEKQSQESGEGRRTEEGSNVK